MSYHQQGYNQPYTNQSGHMQLPYPANMLVEQLIQYPPGNPPILPNVSYMPQALNQYYPLLVSVAIDVISRNAESNPLRVFMFNQMVQNGWNNPDFQSFCDGLVKLVDLRLTTGQFRDPQQAIQACAEYFAQINAAVNVHHHPTLMSFLTPNLEQGVTEVLNLANQTQGEIRNHMQRMQGGYNQQPMQNVYQRHYNNGGYPNQHPINFQQTNQRHQLANAGIGPSQGFQSPSGYGKNIFASNDPIASRFNNRSRPPQTPPPPPTNQFHHTSPIAGYGSSVLTPAPASDPSSSNWPFPNDSSKQEPPQQKDEVKRVKANDNIAWVPSHEKPLNTAYDPTTTDLYYHYASDGSMSTHYVTKEICDMDMSKHLATPSYVGVTSPWANTLDTRVRRMETQRSLEDNALDLANVEPVADPNIVFTDKSYISDTSLEEMWAINEVRLELMRKKMRRANVHRSMAVHITPLITSSDPSAMINDVVKSTSFEEVCKKMKGYTYRFLQGDLSIGDHKALSFINRRLTRYLNDYVRKDLAMPGGTCDSFVTDALDVGPFLEKKYGAQFAKRLNAMEGAIIKNALLMVGEKMTKDMDSNILPGDEKDLEDIRKEVCTTYFYEVISLTSTDLQISEFHFELPTTKVAVGLFPSRTPLLCSIAENALTHARSLGLEFGKHYIRTSDGYTLQILQAAISDNVTLVIPADN